MNGVLEAHLQSIEDFLLVEDKIVTYKWISKKLQVHINTAKQLLYAFSSKEDLNTKLLVTYLIGGEGKNDSGLKFCLVKKEDLDIVINSFEKVICNHVYSIQRDSNIDTSSLYNADTSYELNEEDKRFSSIQRNDEIVKRDLNIYVTIPIQTSEVKSTPIPKKKDVNNDSKKDSEEPKSDSAKSFGENITESKRSISPVKAIKTSPIKPGGHKNKKLNQKNAPSKGGSIGTFFSKQAANAAKKKEIQGKAEMEEKDREEIKENIGKTNSQQEENEMEIEVKNKEPKCTPPITKKENPKKRKKRDKESETSNKRRKRIKVASDSESSSSESEMEVEMEREPTPEPDQVLKESDEEIIPPTPSEKGRKRFKKTINKTFADDDGYIVTKKEDVCLSCSDDEVPTQNNKEENQFNKESTKQTENNKSETSSDKKSQKDYKIENKKKKKSPIKSPKKSPKKSPTKNKQKTIMNFFKRK